MRDYILTPIERKIIEEYLESGKKLEGFKVILFRARKQNPKQISTDVELIKQLLAKAGNAK
jgi:oligoendopeptidase F